MTMLEWPTEHKTFTYNNHPCVSWNRKPVVKDSPAIKWDVQLQPVKYPNLVRSLTLFTKPQPKDTTDTICFENLEGNQKFNVLVKRRINETGAPWSKHYHEFAVQTESKPPDRPPKFLPLGYRYKDQELTVYWEPLKELEWNAPHLEYFVNSKSNRLKASKVGKNFAVFGKWNYKKPDTVFLWSKNEKGLSAEWSRLEVPELTDAMNRKAQNLTLADNILTWEKPVDDENLNGYFFYFCNGTDEVCHSNYTTKLEYNVTGLGAIHKAVAAKYSDHKSGGMKWLSDREDTANIRYVEGIIALLVLGAAFLGARKLKDMSKIGVSVPPGLLLPRTPSVPELAEPSQPYAGVPHPKTLFFNLINMEPIEPADEHIEPEHMEEETSMTVAEQVAQPSGYVMMNAVNPTLCNGYIKPSPPR
ncbi:uncharacterized protein LOC108040203 isoform X2 [Drosophila rhopaloa]|nr:uncharacterized protein LOC108040203 isoform X2 [Drosophila rhopaloa]